MEKFQSHKEFNDWVWPSDIWFSTGVQSSSPFNKPDYYVILRFRDCQFAKIVAKNSICILKFILTPEN